MFRLKDKPVAGCKIDVKISDDLIRNMRIILGPRNTMATGQIKSFIENCNLKNEIIKDLVNGTTESYFKKHNLLHQLRRHCGKYGKYHVTFSNTIENDRQP